MTPFDFDPSARWTAVLAHPDDEIAIGCWLRRLASCGAEVHLVWCFACPHRRQEALAAAAALGIPETCCHFGPLQDGRFTESLAELCAYVGAELGRIGPDGVVCAAFEQGHLDHDAVHFAISQVWSGPCLEFPEYWPYTPRIRCINRFARPSAEFVLPLSPDDQAFKRRLFACHGSQRLEPKMRRFQSLMRLRTGQTPDLLGAERLRWRQPVDYLEPQLPERLACKVRSWPKWQRWEREVRAFLGSAVEAAPACRTSLVEER